MKKFWQMAAVMTLIATTSGCVSYNMSQPVASLSGDVKTDLKADVKVGEVISGESSTNVLFGWLNIGGDNQFADGVSYGGASGGGIGLPLPDPVSSAKAAAAYKAVKSSGSDLIVAPRYEVTVNDYFIFKQVNVKVTGNKGSIQSIR
ncbi:hypothetical protein BWR59_08100 [Pseudomonas sp. Bc-h]|jgi:hypothetical protein|uniref:hypothetical protein n=1 Tax=Pseudomonas sp. Bc-h TaxID=1943632 RepID=UPI0009D9A440|nr:hypothetical protein [Pseudomonas sp. Bc-h]OQR34001.1 hypothetical protein BWR59_08100 [Pseudomonas sp. Bc-h]